MIEEIFKSITNYEGLYEVSNFGRVKSLKFGKEKILKPSTSRGGYLYVILYKNGEKASKLVSRLVAEAFIPNPDPENKVTVDHINQIRDDNRVENLEWLTQQEQVIKSFAQGRVVSKKQKLAMSKNGKANQIISVWFNEKLDQEFTGNSHELARAFPDQKLDSGALRAVRNGKFKQHKGWTKL
jgi:dihydroxyacetone kinase-like predicted kinase